MRDNEVGLQLAMNLIDRLRLDMGLGRMALAPTAQKALDAWLRWADDDSATSMGTVPATTDISTDRAAASHNGENGH